MSTPTTGFLDRLDRGLQRVVRALAFGIALLLVGGGLFCVVASFGLVPGLERIEPAWVGLFMAAMLVPLGLAFFLFARDLPSTPLSSRRHPVLYLTLEALLVIGQGLCLAGASREESAEIRLGLVLLACALLLGLQALDRRWPLREGARTGLPRDGEVRATAGASSVVR